MRAFFFKTVIIISSWMSLKRAHQVADWLAMRVWNRSEKQRRITTTNLSLCCPQLDPAERDALALQAIKETLRSLLELGQLWRKHGDNIDPLIRNIHGLDQFETALAQGRGMLLAAPHFGNWEVLNLWLSKHDKFSFLYKPPKQPGIEQVLLQYRGQGQANQITANARGVRQVFQALKDQHIMAILPDQQPKNGQGMYADFMGHPAYTMTLFSKIAVKTRVPVIMAVAQRLPDHQGFDLHFKTLPDAMHQDLAASVACLNQSIADLIQIDLAQYQWTYKRFSIQADGNNPYQKKGQSED